MRNGSGRGGIAVLIPFGIFIDIFVGLAVFGDDIIDVVKQVALFILDDHFFVFIDEDRHLDLDYLGNLNCYVEIHLLGLAELLGICYP